LLIPEPGDQEVEPFKVIKERNRQLINIDPSFEQRHQRMIGVVLQLDSSNVINAFSLY